jgi:ankyrin repeat protein
MIGTDYGCFSFYPIYLTIRKNDLDMFILLEKLTKDSDVDFESIREDLLYRRKVKEEQEQLVKDFVVFAIMKNASESLFKLLLGSCPDRRCINLTDDGETLLQVAVDCGRRWAVKLLLDYMKVEVNWQDFIGWTILHWAAYCGQISVPKDY